MKFGKAFSDNVTSEGRIIHPDRRVRQSFWTGMGRPLLFFTILLLTLFFLVWRLFDITIVSGKTYRVLSDSNRTKEFVRIAPRGTIYDRTGKILAESIPVYRYVSPCEREQKETVTLCSKIISKEDAQYLEGEELPPHTYLIADFVRKYYYPEITSHIIGYVSEISADELSDPYYSLRQYSSGDKIGRIGAEAVYEEKLRGKNGKELLEVDANGKTLRLLGETPEIPGEFVTLSIDIGIQESAAKAFPAGEKGAVVVTKPSTGEVLTLYSSPTFSSQAFVDGMKPDVFSSLSSNPDMPMFDRAIGGVYPPGSTFKIVTAVGALVEKAISGSTIVEDTGQIVIGPFVFPNWFFLQYGKTDGAVDVVKAIARSNDIFFYKTGEFLGITKLAHFMRQVGIGKPLGIELPGEASGLVPDPAWKKGHFSTPEDKEQRNDEWYLGDTYHVSIGQGYLLTTPLQVNTWTNLIANNGRICTPTIEKKQTGTKSQAKCKDLHIPKETLELVMNGMKHACQNGGTGYPLFNFGVAKPKMPIENPESTPSAEMIGVPVACKTGSAEFGDATQKSHAWFTSFAPIPAMPGAIQPESKTISGEPEITITVLVEGAGEGSDKAAPVAKKIFETWFSR